MKKYDVIVLGGNGFLGSEFVKFLTNKKLKVLSLNSRLNKAIEELKKECITLTILGSYPKVKN